MAVGWPLVAGRGLAWRGASHCDKVGAAVLWPDLPICSGLPCAHPTCPNRLELSPGCMGWSWNRQNHPERPLWPREIISRRLRDRAPVGALPPSPEQRDKAAPLGKGVKPPRRAGYCRELEATGGLAGRGGKPTLEIFQLWHLVATECQS